MLYISESIWPCCRFTCHKQRIVHQLFIQQFGTSHYNFCTEKLPNRGKKRLEIFQSLGPHMVFLLNNNVGNIYSRCLMFDASSSIKLLKNLPKKNPPFLCSETCWGPDIGHSSHKRDGWHNRQRPRDHQPFQSLRWLDFCHVAVNSQVCSLGTKVYQCWFGSVFVSAVSTWLVFVFQMLGIPPSTQKKKLDSTPLQQGTGTTLPTPTPINHQIRGALLLVPQIGLVVTCQSDTFPCAPVLRAQHRRAVLGENSGAGSLCLPKKKTERSSKPTMFRLLEKRNGWWKSWMYGILSNTQGNLWICMLLHPVCFEIVFANHKPFLPFTKLRLVVSMEKKHTSSWFGTPIAHDSAQLGRVLLKMFLISTSFHLIFLQPNKFTWKTS